MKIVNAEVFVTCPGRNFVTLKITTDDGIIGLGDATLNGRELPVASYLKDHLCPQLIGRDAQRIEDPVAAAAAYRAKRWNTISTACHSARAASRRCTRPIIRTTTSNARIQYGSGSSITTT